METDEDIMTNYFSVSKVQCPEGSVSRRFGVTQFNPMESATVAIAIGATDDVIIA